MSTPASARHTTAKPSAATPPARGVTATGAQPKRPGRKPGQKAKEYDFGGLDVSLLANPGAVDETLAARTAPQRARDERQVAMDGVVNKIHNDWIAVGRPQKWAQMPKVSYTIPPRAVEGFKYIVRRAADYHGVAIKWGTSTKDSKTGLERIVFAVRDRRQRETADAGEDEE